MSTNTFFIPSENMIGAGCLADAVNVVRGKGFRRALVVTDKPLNRLGVVDHVVGLLHEAGIEASVFDGTKPNPTIGNVEEGLAMLQADHCDFVISLGGGSPHDCAKGIALCATNGGRIADYEGVDRSAQPQLPLVAINTTAGTASEMTRFCIITDEARHVKMAIVDRHVTPVLSVNDAALMAGMPKGLTAATGMDALTHAVEAYVSTAATPITDACAIKAIELIGDNLRQAVADGADMQAREQMAYAQFLAGMAFNNASLGYVHAMAHQPGALLNKPHGVCNAILLPHGCAFNLIACPQKFADVAVAMGVNTDGLSTMEAGEKGIEAIRKLSKDVGIPAGLGEIGVQESDIERLADNAIKDLCCFFNPRKIKLEDLKRIFKEAL